MKSFLRFDVLYGHFVPECYDWRTLEQEVQEEIALAFFLQWSRTPSGESKNCLSSLPVLALSRTNEPFTIDTDASGNQMERAFFARAKRLRTESY